MRGWSRAQTLNDGLAEPMNILVLGATGVIGRRVVPLLRAQGHVVTAAGRSRERLTRLGAPFATVNMFDREAVARLVRGHTAVVNLATHVPGGGARMFLPGAWKEMDNVRRDGSAIVADAAIAAGVERLVQESIALTYPDSGAHWVEETVPPQPARYNRSAIDAEESAARVTRSGGIGVVLRFALFYGPGDAFTRDILRCVARGWLPFPGRPDAYVPMVAHEDAASAVVAALGVPAGVYNVVDDEPLTRRALGDAVAAIVGAPPPRLLPVWAARLAGSLGETMARSLRLSNRKLRAAAPWDPRYSSAREGLRDAHAPIVRPEGDAAPASVAAS